MFDTDTVKKRLKSFGYEVKADDEFALTFCVEKVRSTIKNEINWNDVPEGLEHIAVDMAVGEFLLSKKTFAPDDLTGFDLEYAVKQIQTGDTNTVWESCKILMTLWNRVQKNLLPGCFAWWSKEHLSDSTRQVQEKRAVH